MEKTYLKSRYNTSVFVCINLIANIAFIIIGIISIKKNGEYVFDFSWLIIFTLSCFGIIFNAHFAYLGMFSRIKMDDGSISAIRVINPERRILYRNIESINLTKELKHFFLRFEMPIIIIEGYDELSNSDIAIKIDYREDLYDNLISLIEQSEKNELKKMDRYFEIQPR
ncbi:MAG: hypothetical protein AB1Z23_02500 [Eubacteriales bacterium]